jgi:hypothetical protein
LVEDCLAGAADDLAAHCLGLHTVPAGQEAAAEVVRRQSIMQVGVAAGAIPAEYQEAVRTVIITSGKIWRTMVPATDEGVGSAALVKRAGAIITAHILEAADE